MIWPALGFFVYVGLASLAISGLVLLWLGVGLEPSPPESEDGSIRPEYHPPFCLACGALVKARVINQVRGEVVYVCVAVGHAWVAGPDGYRRFPSADRCVPDSWGRDGADA